jgi:hypothetical protein
MLAIARPPAWLMLSRQAVTYRLQDLALSKGQSEASSGEDR